MRRSIITMLATVVGMAIFPACSHSGNKSGDDVTSHVPEAVRPIVKAVAEDDSGAFSRLVDYPLARPYPLRDVRTADEMKSYYSTLVDDSLKRVLTGSDTPWQEFGWRGWSAGEGEYIWVDSLIYDVPYVSAAEKETRRTLVAREMASLPREMAEGWEPVRCFRRTDDGTVYRIDRKSEPSKTNGYRLSVYRKGTSLRGKPDESMPGMLTTEGTMETRSYDFADNKGKSVSIREDSPDGSSQTVIVTTPDGDETSGEVEKTYWLDLL